MTDSYQNVPPALLIKTSSLSMLELISLAAPRIDARLARSSLMKVTGTSGWLFFDLINDGLDFWQASSGEKEQLGLPGGENMAAWPPVPPLLGPVVKTADMDSC
jgi:hypothetical protein